MAEKKEFVQGKTPVKFIDIFSGCGGISEGFLRSCEDNKYFDFVLASDISENCELAHKLRYNKQLGIPLKFLKEDIMDESFLQNLLKLIGNQTIDVVVGGPSCQSFSMAGKRKVSDKRDDLFEHYLKVIKALRPKYFVMENVKGILTKYNGQVKDRILSEINSIIDDKYIPNYVAYVKNKLSGKIFPTLLDIYLRKIDIETKRSENEGLQEIVDYFKVVSNEYKEYTKKFPLKVSKCDKRFSTVRHIIELFENYSDIKQILKKTVNLTSIAHIYNDNLEENFNNFIDFLNPKNLAKKAIKELSEMEKEAYLLEVKEAFNVFVLDFNNFTNYLGEKYFQYDAQYGEIVKELHLYNIDNPIIVKASDYGVPQDRERVVFTGCRKDQPMITKIPKTIDTPITASEAISDLDNISYNENCTKYKTNENLTEYEKASRNGRLSDRFSYEDTFYVKKLEDLDNESKHIKYNLYNHQSTIKDENISKRFDIIIKNGGYKESKKELKDKGLDTNKNIYILLEGNKPSKTITTATGDYIHYDSPRNLTVREMARLQSFDDNFVFPGDRMSGGGQKENKITQNMMVGNAVPPLMAKAIGNEILKEIK